METVYSLKGWVKAIIDNENAVVLYQLEESGLAILEKRRWLRWESTIQILERVCQLLDTDNWI